MVLSNTIYITREMAEDVLYIPEWAQRRLKIIDFSKEKEEQENDSNNKNN